MWCSRICLRSRCFFIILLKRRDEIETQETVKLVGQLVDEAILSNGSQ